MPVTPQVTITGTLLDLFGLAVAGGSLTVQLCGFTSLPRVSGTALVARTAPLEINCPAGAFSFALWGNDVITPAGTFYTIQVQDDQGNVIQTSAYQFTGAGTLDLSTVATYDPPTPAAIPLNPVLLNPAGTQTIAGSVIIQGNLTVTGLINPAGPGYSTVVFSATPAFNAGIASTFEITLTGNVTSSTITNATSGQIITFIIIQDGTGNRTFAWPANVNNAPAINAAANGITVQAFTVRANGQLYPLGPATYN